MGFAKIFGHSPKGTEYCRGFVDKHGQWNNGFYCPKWGGADRQYCCGPNDHKFCCPKEEVQEKLHDSDTHNVSLMVGLAFGSFVVLVATIVISCYFCRCCWGYKRRKRVQVGGSTREEGTRSVLSRPRRLDDYPVSYSVCPHGTLLPDFMMPAARYPIDDPPPYPGIPMEEKQPINELEVHPTVEMSHQFHIVSWRQECTGDSVSESEKSGSTADASPLPMKVSDTYPLLNMGTNGGYNKAGECMAPVEIDGAKRKGPLSGNSGSMSFMDSLPGTSWGSETWPRSKATERNHRDHCEMDEILYASTESSESLQG